MVSTKDLERVFTRHAGEMPSIDFTEQCRRIAATYAATENLIAVLSDLGTKRSYLYAGDVAHSFGLRLDDRHTEIPSIWETEIFSLIEPEDLARKHLEELLFFRFLADLPRKERRHYYLISPLRMRTTAGSYRLMAHRIYYFDQPSSDDVRMALCLYGVWPTSDLQTRIVNNVTGETLRLDEQQSERLLSAREVEVLQLVSQGVRSKQIAAMLSISVYTVSRHRQNIIEKLNVANSTEACRVAKELKLI